MESSELMVGRRAQCSAQPSPLLGEVLEVEEAGKSCTPTQPALPPVAPSFSSMKAGHSHHESRSARMHEGEAVLTQGMWEKTPGAVSVKTEIREVLFLLQILLPLNFFPWLFSHFWPWS